MKFYCLADSKYYLWDFWLYQGKDSIRKHSPRDIVADFRIEVEKCHPNQPFIFVADSYYGSLAAAYDLHYAKKGFILSCKSNQPSRLFSQYLHTMVAKSEWAEVHNREMSATTFWDKAKVNILTNLMNGGKAMKSNSATKVLPAALFYYRKWLGSVDHHDRQLHAYYPMHRNIKWHNALLLGLLKIAVNNTWIVAKQQQPDLSLKEAEQHIVKHLSSSNTLRKDSLKPVAALRYDHIDHWPEEATKGRCVHCLSSDKKSNSSYQCSKCKVHLHVLCFKKYHLE